MKNGPPLLATTPNAFLANMLVVLSLFSSVSSTLSSCKRLSLENIVKCVEMEKQPQQSNPLLLTDNLANSNTNTNNEDSLRKPLGIVIGGDRSKRDEWSEGAVSSLLDAYESKWVLRNRAKLKGQDWEDVARHVSSRADSTRFPKTQTQCKNKIESMKKRYRTESAAGDPSSWPLFQRLDLLLRCGAPAPPPAAVETQHESPALNGVDVAAEVRGKRDISDPQQRQLQEDGTGGKLLSEEPYKNPVETDSSTPVCANAKSKMMNIIKRKRGGRMRREEGEEVAESVRWLAEVVMRSEQARLDTMRELERLRAEVEARKGEIDLKRTEIIANAQLEITRLLVGKDGAGTIDSSLRTRKKN